MLAFFISSTLCPELRFLCDTASIQTLLEPTENCVSEDGIHPLPLPFCLYCLPSAAWVPGKAASPSLPVGWLVGTLEPIVSRRGHWKSFTVSEAVMDKMECGLDFTVSSGPCRHLASQWTGQFHYYSMWCKQEAQPQPQLHCLHTLGCIFHYLKVAFKKYLWLWWMPLKGPPAFFPQATLLLATSAFVLRNPVSWSEALQLTQFLIQSPLPQDQVSQDSSRVQLSPSGLGWLRS